MPDIVTLPARDQATGPAVVTGDQIATRYSYSSPYYALTLLTSPARIEQLAIDPTGQGRHMGVVNNYGPRGSGLIASYGGSMIFKEDHAIDAGRPERVTIAPGEIRLEAIPVGSRGLYADWRFIFNERTFDVVIDWDIRTAQTDVWEIGWKLDGIARHIADGTGDDLTAGDRGPYAGHDAQLLWWEDDPRYAHTLVAAFVPGSAERGDNVTLSPDVRRPVTWGAWYTVWTPGGTSLKTGILPGGRWRIGASGKALDRAYAAALSVEIAGGPAAVPAPGTQRQASDRAAAVEWGKDLPLSSEIGTQTQMLQKVDQSWLLTDGQTLAAFVPAADEWKLRIYVAAGGQWQLAATGGPTQRYVAVEPGYAGLNVKSHGLDLHGAVRTVTEELWTLRSAPGRIHVESLDTPVEGAHSHPIHTFLAYPHGLDRDTVGGYDLLASLHLRPQADLVIGQHAMRSPSLAVQKGRASIALVLDLLFHRQHGHYGPEHSPTHFGLCLDFDVANRRIDAPLLGFGWRQMQWVYLDVGVEQGGYYCRDLGEAAPTQPVRVAFDLIVSADTPEYGVIAETQRFLWEQIGHRYFEQSRLPQTQPADAAFDQAWDYWKIRYHSIMQNGVEVGGIRTDQDFPPDIIFSAWFNALRGSYALYGRGRSKGDARMMAQARATLDLILSAPRREGAFPTIAHFTPQGIRWIGSHMNFANQMPWGPTSYHTFDMSWVAYTALRWYQDFQADDQILTFAREYGDFLLRVQLSSGAIPSWLAQRDLAVDPHLRELAQTSASALFLAELAWVTGDGLYRRGAMAAGQFVVERCLRVQRWDDFEVYYSNAPKSEGASDPISGQKAQDTLSMHFAAAALLRLHQLTGEPSWLDAGQQALGAMLQYQAVWLPSFLTVYTYGGFSVQNTDQEWLDARQSQLATTLIDYARETGRADYAERGIAAVRSGYALMNTPSAEMINPRYFDAYPTGWGNENYAHSAYDTPTRSVPTPSYDWGMGSAAPGFTEARGHFGDVWLDLERGQIFGIDDVAASIVRLDGDQLALTITSPGKSRRVKLKATGAAAIRLSVNGAAAQLVSADDLKAGVEVETQGIARLIHNPARVGPVLADEPLPVSVRVLSDQPVEALTLRYRLAGGAWSMLTMQPTDNGTYSALIPASHLRHGQRLDYYVEAQSSGQTISAPEVDPAIVPFHQTPG